MFGVLALGWVYVTAAFPVIEIVRYQFVFQSVFGDRAGDTTKTGPTEPAPCPDTRSQKPEEGRRSSEYSSRTFVASRGLINRTRCHIAKKPQSHGSSLGDQVSVSAKAVMVPVVTHLGDTSRVAPQLPDDICQRGKHFASTREGTIELSLNLSLLDLPSWRDHNRQARLTSHL
jgi:hypothetical protein